LLTFMLDAATATATSLPIKVGVARHMFSRDRRMGLIVRPQLHSAGRMR
jgi:hypothetical protein